MKYKIGDLVRVKIMEGFFASAHYKKGEVFIVNKVSQYNEGQRLSKKDYGVYVMESEVEPVTHLTTKEFIKLVEDMGYEIYNGIEEISIENGSPYGLASVHKTKVNTLGITRTLDMPNDLFKVSAIYANTPLELREEKEELFTLQCPITGDYFAKTNKGHLTRLHKNDLEAERNNGFGQQGKLNSINFTQKEIDDLPNQEFIKILVKEEVK